MRANHAFLAVAVLAGLLPLVGANAAYVLSASAGFVPECNPYLSGCTSVSATGRNPPGSFVYKGTMMPAAVFMLVYWFLAGRWLAAHGDRSLRCRALPWLGLVAAVFLVVYTTVLGHVGEWFAIQRRIGVVGYLSATFFGQLLFVSRIATLMREGRLAIPRWIYVAKLSLCGAMLLLGLAVIPAPLFLSDMDTVERVLEWDFSLLLVLFFPLTAFAWHYDRFGADFFVRK
ncbi:MAG: hypothetical protein KJO54_09150 [Gammaproteobacteria bacterium]|nr:hypothetical protein [Gammaproteobacteria bacterium]NNF61052.1 hypothetical protein [Gammaproteobacteria bacterium]NNM21435.1 hypothetical protein [Gammaproteobacteria bacterium]